MRKIIQLGAALFLLMCLSCGCSPTARAFGAPGGPEPIARMERLYATGFAVDYYPEGYKLLALAGGERFLVIPEGKPCPADLPEEVIPLRQPLQDLYLAAGAVMSFFDVLEQTDAISLSGLKESSWYLPAPAAAMAEGRISFAGKYSEPDYELLLERHCPLAIESTMIERAPEVREKLRDLGIPVLVDRSSKEPHPLGRAEWIKLYGALLNEEEKAEAEFQKQVDHLNRVQAEESTGKTVAFFYITKEGAAVVPGPDSYISRMIALAGGEDLLAQGDVLQSNRSDNKMELEAFFAAAKDADYILYNSTVSGEPESLEALLQQGELLRELKAVRTGNVWCTRNHMFQSTTETGVMVESLHKIFSGKADRFREVPYFYCLQ